jgi:hypothetical protein
LQKNVVEQSASELHAPWQAVFVGLHGVVAPQGTGFCVGQTPLLQVTDGIAAALGITPEHDGATPHGVVFGIAVLHTPPWQVSTVHTLPSFVHGVPSETFTCVQPVAGLHPSVVHGLPSLQFGAGPGTQLPLWHASVVVQKLPSSQGVPFALFCAAQPPGSLHTPLWH